MATYKPNWSTMPLGANGQKLEFNRDYVCFSEDRAGERVTYKEVMFSQKPVTAEVILSGFNMWYTRGGDCEVTQIRVDAWIDCIGTEGWNPEFKTKEEIEKKERTVSIKFMYTLKDEDPTGPEDFNDACIGFTVIALTQP